MPVFYVMERKSAPTDSGNNKDISPSSQHRVRAGRGKVGVQDIVPPF